MKPLILLTAGLLAWSLVSTIDVRAQKSATPIKTNQRPQPAPTPVPTEQFEKADLESMKLQCVVLQTEMGNIALEFSPESAPEAVRNFLNLSSLGAFDTTTFDRVIKDFVIQGGNPSSRETSTAALKARMRRTIPDEPNKINHVRGVVSMAKSDQPNSASSSFFIVVKDSLFLDGTYAAFGRVTSGMEVADAINSAATEGEKPLNPVKLTKALVRRCVE